MCLDGDSVPVREVPALLLADSGFLPSRHSQGVSAVADVTTALAG